MTYPLRIVAVALAGACVLTACGDDFLERQPVAGYTAGNLYDSGDRVTRALTPAYAGIRQLFVQHGWKLGDLRSDNTTFTFNPGDGGQANVWQTDLFVSGNAVSGANDFWNDSYQNIGRMNLLLANIGGADFRGDEEQRTRREAEARYLRAFYYWLLIRNFGDAVIILEPEFEEDALLALDRRPVAEVMAEAIVPDLEFAIANLPLNYDDLPAENGRATQGAARTLLAKAHFVTRDYAAALPLIEAVIASNEYRLLGDYAAVFLPENSYNNEIIFAATFNASAGVGAGFVNGWLPFNSGNDISQSPDVQAVGGGVNRPTFDLYRAYPDNDARRDVNIGVYLSGADTLLYPAKYIYPPLARGGGDVDWPIFRYADVLLMRAEALAAAEGGYSDAGLSDVNAIRARAGLPPAFPGNADSTLDVRTPDQYQALLLRERRLELALEAYRWYDLVRFGVAEEVMQARRREEYAQGGYISQFSGTDSAFTQIPTLYPIPPIQVIQYGYEQNPGY